MSSHQLLHIVETEHLSTELKKSHKNKKHYPIIL